MIAVDVDAIAKPAKPPQRSSWVKPVVAATMSPQKYSSLPWPKGWASSGGRSLRRQAASRHSIGTLDASCPPWPRAETPAARR